MILYPISVLVLGKELREHEQTHGVPTSVVEPFGHAISRLCPSGYSLRFEMVRNSICKVETLVAIGPALIERVEIGPVLAYDRHVAQDDGRLFFMPHRTLERIGLLVVHIRVRPELFMYEIDDDRTYAAVHKVAPSPVAQDEPIVDYAPDFGAEPFDAQREIDRMKGRPR